MYITALDLGSSHIKGIVAEIRKDGSIVVVKAMKRQSRGIKKGEIIYPEEAVKSLFEVLSDVKHFDKKALKNLVFGISGTKVRFHLSRAAVAIPRNEFEITEDDVDRVIRESMAVTLPTGWQIIHSFPREFIIDDIEVDDTNVVGLSGRKLEANVVLISVFSSIYKNFMRLAQLVLGKRSDFDGSIIFTPLAVERAILTKSQKDLGVVAIDIGMGTTSFVVYHDGRMVLAKVLPVGSGNITNDIAIGLKCSVDTAEAVKRALGCAYARDVSTKEKVDLSQYEDGLSASVSRKYIAEIVEVRVREIFSHIHEELKSMGFAGKLPGGAVITGGGAHLIGISDIARDELRMPAHIAAPNIKEVEIANNHIADDINNPEMSAALGLVLSRIDLMSKKGFSAGLRDGNSYNLSEHWFMKIVKILLFTKE